eukprot:scaffold59450_cov57-Phaeocystis_antarctica.AAC.6
MFPSTRSKAWCGLRREAAAAVCSHAPIVGADSAALARPQACVWRCCAHQVSRSSSRSSCRTHRVAAWG